eukprot:1818748-Pyramimonas_sp.AAC.1
MGVAYTRAAAASCAPRDGAATGFTSRRPRGTTTTTGRRIVTCPPSPAAAWGTPPRETGRVYLGAGRVFERRGSERVSIGRADRAAGRGTPPARPSGCPTASGWTAGSRGTA